ncbi:hypothetical protein ACO0QE_002774 [Hanseniaspora vineae]
MARKSNKKTNQRKKLQQFTKRRNLTPQRSGTPVSVNSSVASQTSEPPIAPAHTVSQDISTIATISDKQGPQVEAAEEAPVRSTPPQEEQAPTQQTPPLQPAQQPSPDEEQELDEADEITPLIANKDEYGVKSANARPIMDPSLDFPGIVASEVQGLEDDYLERRSQLSMKHSRANSTYSSISKTTRTPYETSVSKSDEDEQMTKQPHGLSKTRVRIILWSMYLGIFLASLDISIVSTLLTHIASEFNELERISFIVTAYLLSNATFQPLYGKISDIFGRKSVFIFCNIMFSAGCYCCGVSNGLWGLVIGRFVSGIGGGGMTSMATIATSDLVSLRDRAYYQGIGNMFYGLGIAIGGLVGGSINDWFGWRWAFLLQVPLSALSCLAIVIYMNLPKPDASLYGSNMKEKLGKIDWWGSLVLITFLALFILGSNVYVYLASFMFMLLFIYIELNIKSKDPILPVQFLKDRSVFGASFANWFCMMTSITLLYYLPIYWSTIIELSATETGKRLAPNFFSTGFGSLGSGIYLKRTGKYYNFLMGWSIFGILGCLKIWLINPSVSVLEQYMMFVVPGFAMSVMITITLLVIIAAVPKEHQASCTSISYAFRSTGSTIGVSIGGAIFKKTVEKLLYKKVLPLESPEHPKKELLKIIETAMKNSDYVKSAPSFVKPILKDCYNYGLKNTFLFCLIAFSLATLSVSMVREFKLHTSAERDDLAEEEGLSEESAAV